MKRQSKAEEALKKQIKIIDQRIAEYNRTRDAISEQIRATEFIRNQLDDEVGRLEKARVKASTDRKP
jgi:prefoldin subunit 5